MLITGHIYKNEYGPVLGRNHPSGIFKILRCTDDSMTKRIMKAAIYNDYRALASNREHKYFVCQYEIVDGQLIPTTNREIEVDSSYEMNYKDYTNREKDLLV